MALRSVIVEAPASPPASRRTVVVRAGGPAPKGRVLDVIVGVVGAILLIAAIALAQVLPDKTYLNPQFRLALEEFNGEFPSQETPSPLLEAGPDSFEFAFVIDVDNVKSISLDLGFEDDVSYSLPDRFDIDLIAPNQTLAGHAELQNPDPEGGASATDPPTFERAKLTVQFTIGPQFSEQIVTGLTPTETPEQVLARLAPDYHVANNGTWIVRVTLVAAGDCPGPGEGYAAQALHCRFGPPSGGGDPSPTPDGADPGNDFLLAGFRYTYFVPAIQELN